MKKIIVLFAFIVLSISAFPQSDNWYFSFSMGGTWPLGAFMKSDITNPESGYAKKGFALVLDATYPLTDHWGLKGMTLLNNNPVDRSGLGTMLETRMNAVNIPSPVLTDRQYLSLTVNSWMWNALLAGPVYSINLGRVFWDFQLLAGMNVAYLPQQKLSYVNPANDFTYLDSNTATTNVSYGILAGTAFRFPVSDHLNLKLGLDYYWSGARVQYNQIKVSKQGDTYVTEKLGSGSTLIPIKMVTGTIGVVYYLN